MRRARLLWGCLQPDSTSPFLLLPHTPEPSGAGGGGAAPPPPGNGPPAGGQPGNQPPPNGGQQHGTGGAGGTSDKGYPDDTPVEQMSATEQAAYWKAHARKHEHRNRELSAWKTENESKLSDYDRIVESGRTEHEKALEAAKADGAATARREGVRALVDAEFRAAAMGALTREQVGEILAPLDPTHFMTSDGKVDADKVSAYVSKVVPAAGGSGADGARNGQPGANGGTGTKWPDTGGGSRGGSPAGTGTVAAGRDLYARMKNPQKTTT